MNNMNYYYEDEDDDDNGPHRNTYFTSRLTDLTNVLQDANRNFRDIDAKIEQQAGNRNHRKSTSFRHNRHHHKPTYRGHHQHHSADRYKTYRSPEEYYEKNRSSMSDNEEELTNGYHHKSKCMKRSGRSRNRRNVYLNEDLNESLHELHKKVRDISFEQEKLAEQLNAERQLCNNQKVYLVKAANNSEKQASPSKIIYEKKSSSNEMDTSIERRLDKRINNIYSKIRKEKDRQIGSISAHNEIKTLLDEFRKTSREDLEVKNQIAQENDRQKTLNELILAKKRLYELEESKVSLSQEVKNLKDQLNSFQSSIPVQTNSNNSNNCNSSRSGCNSGCCKCYTEKEVSCNSNKSAVSHEPRLYDREKEYLTENIQTLRIVIKEKETRESQLHNDLKLLNEKLEQSEKEKLKLRSELEAENSKLKEISKQSEKYVNYLQTCEDQLDMSEKKREELKQDAHDTIKLWKNKVKKLEKNIERLKCEADSLIQQNEFLKSGEHNLSIQIESKTQEVSVLRNVNTNLEEKTKLQELEINHLKEMCEELKNENTTLKSDFQNVKANNQNKYYEYQQQIERSNANNASEDSAKYKELYQKINELQSELDLMKNERKEFESYIIKLETDYQKIKVTLENAERAEQEAKNDLMNYSKQFVQNKESFEETIAKYTNQIQQNQLQLQRLRLESEDKIRILHAQLVEEKSTLEIMRKREYQYINEIDELKSNRRKVEDELNEFKAKCDKLGKNEGEKSRLVNDMEEKYNRLLNEFSQQNNHFLNKESDYLKMLNSIDVDIDLINSLVESNANESYKPILNLENSDKSNYLYLLIKHKIHWFGKVLEELFQREYKLKQNIIFLEHDLEANKKTHGSNMKTQSLFLKNLQHQNNELLSERAIALKNMELLEKYLNSLTESIKNHSAKEIERTHHLFAIDNIYSLCNNQNLSQAEKNEIYERFKQYKNTISDLKLQLDKNWPKVETIVSTSTYSLNKDGQKSFTTKYKNTKTNKPKPFKC